MIEVETKNASLDTLADSLESELRDVLRHYREALKQHLTQEPVAILERDPSIGRLRVTYEDCITELEAGTYPLYVQPQGWREGGRSEWVSITREEVLDLTDAETHPLEFARAIESKLKEKNT